MSLKGKVVIITGASSGIGAATAKIFAEQEAILSLIGRNEKRLIEVANHCEAAKGIKPLCILLDLTVGNNCETLVRKTVQTFNRIDVLINCAGKQSLTSLFDKTMESFDDLVALNLRVPYNLTQLCVPHLKLTKGNVINVFGAAMRVRPGYLTFAMIYAAMERFTKVAAIELAGEGIRMNSVRPGITRTNFIRNLNITDAESIDLAYNTLSSLVPNNVILSPEEVGRSILCVLTDMSQNMIGSNVVIDGGAYSYT